MRNLTINLASHDFEDHVSAKFQEFKSVGSMASYQFNYAYLCILQLCC